MNEKFKERRSFKTRSIAEIAGRVSDRAFRRYGFLKSDVIMHWADIVGTVLARSSLPERLVLPRNTETINTQKKAGTLHIRIDGSFAPEMQHLEPLVIERINSYYGFKAVEKLVFHHGIVNYEKPRRTYSEPILSDSQKKDLDSCLKNIKDEKLKKSLYKVGAEIISQQKPTEVKHSKRFTRRGRGSLHKTDKKQN